MQLSAENTALVLDSTADCPDARARSENWRMVPLYVRFGDETLRDYVDIAPDEFYKRLKDVTGGAQDLAADAGRLRRRL